MTKPLARVRYFELYGTRQAKYDWLWTHSLADLCPEPDGWADMPASRPEGPAPSNQPPLASFVFPPLDVALFANAVPVPEAVYQGLCRLLVEIETMLGLAHCADAVLAVQVAQWAEDDATARWIAENPSEFSRGCGAGFLGGKP